jgi:hypothetical protein
MVRYRTVIVFIVSIVVGVRLFFHRTFQISNLAKVWDNIMQQLVKLFAAGIGCERAPITYQIHDHPF